MLPERTTTMGEGESEMTERPFHIMKAVERIKPKFRTWARACRGFCRKENMAVGEGELDVLETVGKIGRS